ncbi:MAG: pilin [Gammaproteobacteria bacterium]|nr:pilin [Gammaproteobacteria bacterium]
MRKSIAAFTLIELMVVVAIIGILASVAIPAYQNYVVRSQVSESLQLVKEAKLKVSEFRNQYGRLPGSNQSAGLPSPSSIIASYTQSVAITNNGIVLLTFGNKVSQTIDGLQLALSPATPGASLTSSSPLVWVCGFATTPAGTQEITGSAAADNTNTPDKVLPGSCRP